MLACSTVEVGCTEGSEFDTGLFEDVSAFSHANGIITNQLSKIDNRTAKDFSNSHCGRPFNELNRGHM